MRSPPFSNCFSKDPDLVNTFYLVNIRELMFIERPYFELELEAVDNARYPQYDKSRATISMTFYILHHNNFREIHI